jgi:hypothetical protein
MQAVGIRSAQEVKTMTEYQKIAIGLLGMTHPEVQLLTQQVKEKAAQRASAKVISPARGDAPVPRARRRTKGSMSLLRAIKFAFVALFAGSRAVPLGDNRQLTKELGAYGGRLRRCA